MMGKRLTANTRQKGFRFHLFLGACLLLNLPTHAQTTPFDPFSPNAVAPTEPTASPTAPTPVAPQLPPLPEPAPTPAPVVQQAPVPAPTSVETPITQEIVKESPAPQPTPSEAKMFKMKDGQNTETPPQEDSSFFDRLANFFSTEDKPAQEKNVDPVKEAPPVKAETVEKPVMKEVKQVPSVPDLPPQSVEETTPIKVKPTPVAEVAPEPQPQPFSVNPNAQPFEPQQLAPTTPVESPAEVTNIETVAPKAEDTSSSPGILERLFSSEEKPVRSIVVEAEPAPKETAVEKTIKPRVLEAQSVPDEGGLFDTIGNFFGNMLGSDKETEQKAKPLPVIEKVDPVDKIPSQEEKPKAPLDPRLLKARFALGEDISLGQSDDDLSSEARCFTKNRGTVAYCITPTRWPVRIARHFDVSTHLYKGAQGITQYDGDIATRLYTLFNQEGFDTIVAYYEKNFGPATHKFERKTRTVKQGTLPNPTYIWRREKPDEGLTEVFEIRKIADTRGSIPDLQRGSIRIYFEGSRQIFSITSDLDYMELK
ncbi:MAG: hypothetical protein HWE30_02850 [Methylocystaceae bacterium]|nr:hypothetical protein [Methylocystaceae bacterium]